MPKWLGSVLAILAYAGWAGNASAVPITDTVTVDGREWAQVDLFFGVQDWYVDALCPAGTCGDFTLNDYDMLGWTWASDDDVIALFNTYLGSGVLGPGADTYTEIDSAWAPAFFADGWRATVTSAFVREIRGSTQTAWPYGGFLRDGIQGRADTASVNDSFLLPLDQGKWFYRDATSVPSSPSILLLGLGLAVLGYRRRNADPGK
mgnify:CR=1 FL=1